MPTNASQTTELIAENLERVQTQIANACQRVGRDPNEVRLVVVTKTQPIDVIQNAVAAGATYLGENYVEEATPKILALNQEPGVEWHMIGHVQSRKAATVVEAFNVVHSLDSLKLARRFDRFAGEQGRKLPVLLECNVSGEESKFGWPAWQESGWEALYPEFEEVCSLPNLQVRGLMTMAPFLDNPEDARHYFRRLGRLREVLSGRYPKAVFDELSMGMSADFEVAVEEGATWVRIGQAILPRKA